MREVEGRAAIGALHEFHLGLERGELGTGHRADKILLEQELEERREPPVAELAAEIREARRVLQIVRQGQARMTTGAAEQGR